jgi:NAD(P)-dependent dehydrogenase (short-subunit alcohol dehydrogenase family)
VKRPADFKSFAIPDVVVDAVDGDAVAASASEPHVYGSSMPTSVSQQLVCKPISQSHIKASEPMWSEAIDLADFPKGKLDTSGQPLDLTAKNSWDRKLCEVSTLELLQTLAANAAAPFIMCSRLASVMEPPTKDDPYGHIVNVQALEGKFSVKKKSRCHPHTNMAKAALNMLTHTSASDLFTRRILMNNADTGWVTDMASGGVGPMAASHATFVAVPMDEIDGASRVLDPVFSHVNDPTWLIRGKLFKDYSVVNW